MSSSPPERSFVAFLAESLERLRDERPDVHRALCACLAPRVVRLCVDGETLALAFTADEVRKTRAEAPAAVEIESTRDAILAVVDGEASLTESVLADGLRMRGACDDLLAFHDGFLLYVHGAVRAPSFPALLREFRRTTPPPRG